MENAHDGTLGVERLCPWYMPWYCPGPGVASICLKVRPPKENFFPVPIDPVTLYAPGPGLVGPRVIDHLNEFSLVLLRECGLRWIGQAVMRMDGHTTDSQENDKKLNDRQLQLIFNKGLRASGNATSQSG